MTTPNMVHMWEQFRAFSADMAKATHSYYASLVAEGFQPSEALFLTQAWQSALVHALFPKKESHD